MIIKTVTQKSFQELFYFHQLESLLVIAKQNGWITETAQSFDVSAKTKEPEMEYIHEYVNESADVYRIYNWETPAEAEARFSETNYAYHRLDWTGRPRKLKRELKITD